MVECNGHFDGPIPPHGTAKRQRNEIDKETENPPVPRKIGAAPKSELSGTGKYHHRDLLFK